MNEQAQVLNCLVVVSRTCRAHGGALTGLLLLVPAVVCIGCLHSSRTHVVARTQNIADGQIQVDAVKIVCYRVDVAPGARDAVVKGSFGASGGSGNDIRAVFADEDNCINRSNGHEAQALWSTKGRQTVGNFSVGVKPGGCYLGLSTSFRSSATSRSD